MASDKRLMLLRTAVTLALAAAGGVSFNALGIPAGWLSGAMVVTAAASCAGVQLALPSAMRDICFLFLGVFIGTMVTKEVFEGIGRWPLSLLLLGLALPLSVFLVRQYLVKRAGWDNPTALFAAMPGGTTQTLIMALDMGADMHRVTVAHLLRLFLLIGLLPALIALEGPAGIVTSPVRSVDALQLLILISAAAVGGLVGKRMGVPIGTMIGSLVVSATLCGTGLLTTGIPSALQIVIFVTLGAMIGHRFVRISWNALARMLSASLCAFVIAMIVCASGASIAWSLAGAGFAEALIAFAPGGFESMLALTIAFGLNPVYVSVHHIARMLGVAIFVPLIAPVIRRSIS